MTVLNKHKQGIPTGAIYIGRGSKWGNPFIIGRDGDRDAVCEKYEEYLKKQVQAGTVTLEELAVLNGKDLVCFCAPARCHGDTLEQMSKWAAEQLETQERK